MRDCFLLILLLSLPHVKPTSPRPCSESRTAYQWLARLPYRARALGHDRRKSRMKREKRGSDRIGSSSGSRSYHGSSENPVAATRDSQRIAAAESRSDLASSRRVTRRVSW